MSYLVYGLDVVFSPSEKIDPILLIISLFTYNVVGSIHAISFSFIFKW